MCHFLNLDYSWPILSPKLAPNKQVLHRILVDTLLSSPGMGRKYNLI